MPCSGTSRSFTWPSADLASLRNRHAPSTAPCATTAWQGSGQRHLTGQAACSKPRRRFDHHCIWINNCVGVGNHVLSSALASVDGAVTALSRLSFSKVSGCTPRDLLLRLRLRPRLLEQNATHHCPFCSPGLTATILYNLIVSRLKEFEIYSELPPRAERGAVAL